MYHIKKAPSNYEFSWKLAAFHHSVKQAAPDTLFPPARYTRGACYFISKFQNNPNKQLRSQISFF